MKKTFFLLAVIMIMSLFPLTAFAAGRNADAQTHPSYIAGVPVGSDETRYDFLFGTDVVYWTTDNRPSGYETKKQAREHMTDITVPCWKMKSSGEKYASEKTIPVNSKLANMVRRIFNEIYRLPEQFPIDTLVGFRWSSNSKASGPFLEDITCMSAHAYGGAIDINYNQNDYYVGKGQDLRDKNNPYYITDSVRKIFEKYGWFWGGDYSICADTMHFQYTGLDMLSYNTGNPFVEYTVIHPEMKSRRIKNVQRRLKKLGYKGFSCDGRYGEKTAEAIKAFQIQNGLNVTGSTTEETYIMLYNLTHDMSDR